ncbi:MAG: hypothetical protein A2036_01400 [Omnitrophica bacterium GWA2_50_21]|nr:MAG: hypothetical protein A2036_01400 [Omnitrophica bacterium GWA2_50_21]
MIDEREYWKRLEMFMPTVYDAFPDDVNILNQYRHRAYSVGSLYYQAYREIAGDLLKNGSLVDVGAYPGTFLRLLKEVFFRDVPIRFGGIGMILPEDEENYRHKALQCRDVEFLKTDKNFKNYFNSIGIEFCEVNFDYCFEPSLELPRSFQECFDVVTCLEVIEHLHTPHKLIRLISQLLKPQGVCIIETNNVANLIGILKLFLTRESNLDFELVERYSPGNYSTKHPHVRFYSMKEIEYLLRKTGFSVETSRAFNWSIPKQFFKTSNLSEALRQVLLKLIPGKQSHILLKGRKISA